MVDLRLTPGDYHMVVLWETFSDIQRGLEEGRILYRATLQIPVRVLPPSFEEFPEVLPTSGDILHI